jgi:hypothetical protein
MGVDRKEDIRSEALLLYIDVSEEQARQAALQVCNPRFKMTVKERSDILKALGLKEDPLHREMEHYYGSKRKS